MITPDTVTEVDMLEQVELKIKADTRTHVPGVVVSYDPILRKAKVQPMRQGKDASGTPYVLAMAPAAPVLWPRFAGMIIVGRLNPGDTVMLAVTDRELDQFLISPPGVPHQQKSGRCHELTDAVVVLGLSQDTDPVAPPANPGVLHVGREDLLAFVQIGIDVRHTVLQGTGPGSIRLGPLAAQPIMHGITFNGLLATLAGAEAAYGSAIATAFTTWGMTMPATPLSNGVFISALAGAEVTRTAAWATFIAAAATWLSLKALSE